MPRGEHHGRGGTDGPVAQRSPAAPCNLLTGLPGLSQRPHPPTRSRVDAVIRPAPTGRTGGAGGRPRPAARPALHYAQACFTGGGQ